LIVCAAGSSPAYDLEVATRLDRLKSTVDDLREDARDLAARPHDPEQMGTFVRSGATALERLLKRLRLR
jgi:hypothetical protein